MSSLHIGIVNCEEGVWAEILKKSQYRVDDASRAQLSIAADIF